MGLLPSVSRSSSLVCTLLLLSRHRRDELDARTLQFLAVLFAVVTVFALVLGEAVP